MLGLENFPHPTWEVKGSGDCEFSYHISHMASAKWEVGLKLQENPQSFVRDAAILKQWIRDNAMGPGALHWKIAITHGRGVCKSGRIKLPRRKLLSAGVGQSSPRIFSHSQRDRVQAEGGPFDGL